VSIQDIQENPQDISNFYLANIYQTLANPNGFNVSISPPSSPPPFSPPNLAVWVNALWFLSLVISLTCALLATLLQQWARRYLKITQSRYSPHKRARIRAFFAEGVEKCLLPWAVEILPTLLHISLFLFFAGLVVFLSNVNLTIFKLVLSWVGLCLALYGCITCMPILRLDSPYYTPLSLPAWHIVTRTLFPIYRLLRWFNLSVKYRSSAYHRYLELEESCRKSLVQGMQKITEKTALKSSSEMDTRAFMWTFDSLDEDHELEYFFSGLPGFRSSDVVKDPLSSLTEEDKWKLYVTLRELMYRTFSSDLLPTPVKNRRAIICAKAVVPEHMPNAWRIVNRILFEYQYSGPLATRIAKILRGWGNTVAQDNILYARFAISKIIATSQPHDDPWYILVSDELGLSEPVLRDYAAHGDNLPLVILIHVVRQQFSHFRKPSWRGYEFSFVLAAASKFNALDTSPELQHEFCALWNQIVREVRDGGDRQMAPLILGRIRGIYLSLHADTDSTPTLFPTSTNDMDTILEVPSLYPVCNVPGHHPNSPPLIHDGSASATISRSVLHDHDTTALVPSLADNLALTPLSTYSPLPIHESPTNTPPLDENTSVTVQTGTTTEIRLTSPNPIPTGATHRILDTSPRVTHLYTSEPSSAIPTKSNASTLPLGPITVEPAAVSHIPLSDIEVPSSPCHTSPTPVLDNVLPISMLLL
jgi:hypothetical protein